MDIYTNIFFILHMIYKYYVDNINEYNTYFFFYINFICIIT